MHRNPEVQEARRLQIPVIPRGEMLAELMRLKYGIAIAGQPRQNHHNIHDRHSAERGGLDPTVVVGGKVASMGGSNARVGQSDFLVVESDESDGSFLKLSPILAVVTNIDREHLDHYASIVEIRAAFLEFVQKVPFYGAAILVPGRRKRPAIASGREPSNHHLRAQPSGRTADRGRRLRTVREPFHRAGAGARAGKVPSARPRNSQRAERDRRDCRGVGAGGKAGSDSGSHRELFAASTEDSRRAALERGVTVIDDYGHHPTEIRATLAAAQLCKFRRIHAVFQPHRYTRTQHLMDEFAKSFHQADIVYRARHLCGVGRSHRGRQRCKPWPSVCGTSAIGASNTQGPSNVPLTS